MPRFPFFEDTHPDVLEKFIEMQARMTPAEKLHRLGEHARFAQSLAESAERQADLGASPREIFLRALARRIDPGLVRKAYGWEPPQ